MADEDEHKYGEEHYKAMGSPMFGKLWTFQELEIVERPAGPGRVVRGKKMMDRNFKRPDNWPPDTEVEPGRWVGWLPEGWAQGIRTQALSGKKLSCYMSPQGKRFWHKKDIEKHLGYLLPSMVAPPPDPAEKALDGTVKTRSRYVSDADAIPNWPEDSEDWLPQDWKIGFRQLPSGLHRIFVPPGYEDEGFLYHRSTVMQWIAGEVTTVSPFGTSKPATVISAMAAEKGTGGVKRRKTHHSFERPAKIAEPKDFEEVSGMRVLQLAGSALESLQAASVEDAEKLASDAQNLQAVLSGYHFEDTSLLYVFQSGEQQHPAAVFVDGFYYKRPTDHNGRDAYQKIVPLAAPAPEDPEKPAPPPRAACSSFHIYWSTLWDGHWKIGKMDSDDCGAGYAAICHDTTMQSGWKLLRSDLVQKSTQGNVKLGAAPAAP